MILDLRKGICETDSYKAWKFPGGELKPIFKDGEFIKETTITEIRERLNKTK